MGSDLPALGGCVNGLMTMPGDSGREEEPGPLVSLSRQCLLINGKFIEIWVGTSRTMPQRTGS